MFRPSRVGRVAVVISAGAARRSVPGSVRSSSSSGGGSGSSYAATGPSTRLKSWESGARLVRNTTVENNKYLEHIREVHDPSQHLKTIEDELKGTIGKALGKQGEKVLQALCDFMQRFEFLNNRLARSSIASAM